MKIIKDRASIEWILFFVPNLMDPPSYIIPRKSIKGEKQSESQWIVWVWHLISYVLVILGVVNRLGDVVLTTEDRDVPGP